MREKKNIESNFWKNRVEKEISALKRVSNAETKKNIEKEKAALKKVSKAEKNRKRKSRVEKSEQR